MESLLIGSVYTYIFVLTAGFQTFKHFTNKMSEATATMDEVEEHPAEQQAGADGEGNAVLQNLMAPDVKKKRRVSRREAGLEIWEIDRVVNESLI